MYDVRAFEARSTSFGKRLAPSEGIVWGHAGPKPMARSPWSRWEN